MPNTTVELSGYLLITEAITKCYTEVHEKHSFHRNPSRFILLWLLADNAIPGSKQEPDTDAVAHRSLFTAYDLPSVSLFIAYANHTLFPVLSKLQKLTRGKSSCGPLPFLCCNLGFITTGENKIV